jgi:phosphatidylserine/phosphatidylglycerophosphate/cardiolipin synthase-like enzyme
VPPWRDTGVEIEGPAVIDLSAAFGAVWAEAGPPLPASDLSSHADAATAGGVTLRVIATEPATAGLYRVDPLVAVLARYRLWITEAYFVGVPSYTQAMRAAALDGVDVRLLVPGTSDLGIVKRLGVAGYRPLLEAGEASRWPPQARCGSGARSVRRSAAPRARSGGQQRPRLGRGRTMRAEQDDSRSTELGPPGSATGQPS